jgi:hypothetical protein
MPKLDEAHAAQTAALLNVAVDESDAARMAAQIGPPLAIVASQHLPFDSEPSNLVRNLARGAK